MADDGSSSPLPTGSSVANGTASPSCTPINSAATNSDASSDTQKSSRERRRLSERKSRAKRKINFELMHKQIQVLECAVVNVPYAIPEARPTNALIANDDHGSDDTTQAMRDFLRRSHVLAREATQLRAENQELTAMMARRNDALQTLRQLTLGMRVDEWSQHSERWRETMLATWIDWPHEACTELIHDSMTKIRNFSFEGDSAQTTGMSFNGWRDRRRLDAAAATIHFSFTKTYRNADAESMACGYWDMHLDDSKYKRCMLGPAVQCYYEIVQHVTPDICIVRCVEQYPHMPIKIHMLFLIFRVRTSTGFIQCLRSIPCPELQRATLDEDAYWTTNFHWTQWDILARNTQGESTSVRTSVSGSIASSTADYANRWMGEAILTLVRAESILLGQNFLNL